MAMGLTLVMLGITPWQDASCMQQQTKRVQWCAATHAVLNQPGLKTCAAQEANAEAQ
jgi:hypothetical protein